MHPRVDFLADELIGVLHQTADFLGANQIKLERLTVTSGLPVRVTAEFPADTPDATVQQFARALRPRTGLAPAIPFHWQADGAGDDRVV